MARLSVPGQLGQLRGGLDRVVSCPGSDHCPVRYRRVTLVWAHNTGLSYQGYTSAFSWSDLFILSSTVHWPCVEIGEIGGFMTRKEGAFLCGGNHHIGAGRGGSQSSRGVWSLRFVSRIPVGFSVSGSVPCYQMGWKCVYFGHLDTGRTWVGQRWLKSPVRGYKVVGVGGREGRKGVGGSMAGCGLVSAYQTVRVIFALPFGGGGGGGVEWTAPECVTS